MTHAEMIEVIKAHSEGKAIEVQKIPGGEWTPTIAPLWDFFDFNYRIAPPKPREVFLFPHGGFPSGLSTSPPMGSYVSKPIKFREVLDE